jgi:hypothetical protein
MIENMKEDGNETPILPIPNMGSTPEIAAQAAVEEQPATATQEAQPAQPATPRILAKGGWNIPWFTVGLVFLVAITSFMGGWVWKGDEMLLEFMISKFFFVVPMVIGSLAFWWILRWMGMSTGVPWSEIYDELKKGNMAMARYFGARILAVGIVVGACVIAGTSV